MSLSDKILDIFSKHKSLSSTQLQRILAEEYGEKRTLRTIQRYISRLVDEGKIFPNPPVGREQTYSLRTEKVDEKYEITSYLLKRFWREEEEIEKELVYGNPTRAYRKAKLLWLKFHNKYKQIAYPTLKEITERLKKINKEENIDFYRIQRTRSMLNRYLPVLISKISETLYEMEKDLVKS